MLVFLRVSATLLIAAFCAALRQSPPPTLNGPVGRDLRVMAVPRASAFDHIKHCQIQQLGRNAPAHICRELDVARELLRDPGRTECQTAFLFPRRSDQVLFTIVYRVRDVYPRVYTIEAVIREPGHDVRSSDLQDVIRQLVVDNRGFLQAYPLKTWARGKYFIESSLEKRFSDL